MLMGLKSSAFQLGAASFLLFSLVACSSSDSPAPIVATTTQPAVASTTPAAGAIGVAPNGNLSVTFSQAMNPASLNTSTFTLASGTPAVAVAGTVIYAGSTATFWPGAHLASNTMYTATITTGAMSAAGMAISAMHAWTFTTGTTLTAGLPVNLGTAGTYVILAKSGISTVPASAVTGNLGLSPAAASFITGFSLIADATNVFSTSPQVTGKIYAADYAAPTPSNLTTAVGDMQTAFTDAAGRAPDVTELGAGNIGGMTLAPKVYKWGTSLLIPTDVTLNGSATDVWIFQIAQNLTMSSAAKVLLTGGALPKNVFWQVAGAVDLGTTSHCEGILLTQTAINLRTGASVNGRLLAQTAVTIDGSTVVEPAP
ncbi:MAG: ice-binding family protein [Geothrix sp.]|nr:ice-binding family protein [Geothrix sp.]